MTDGPLCFYLICSRTGDFSRVGWTSLFHFWVFLKSKLGSQLVVEFYKIVPPSTTNGSLTIIHYVKSPYSLGQPARPLPSVEFVSPNSPVDLGSFSPRTLSSLRVLRHRTPVTHSDRLTLPPKYVILSSDQPVRSRDDTSGTHNLVSRILSSLWHPSKTRPFIVSLSL